MKKKGSANICGQKKTRFSHIIGRGYVKNFLKKRKSLNICKAKKLIDQKFKQFHYNKEVAAYEFTTLTTVPGVIKYKGAKIQLLDLPGIIEGAKDGKGRGKQVIAGIIN